MGVRVKGDHRHAGAREGRLNRSSAHKVLQQIVPEANTTLPETERIALAHGLEELGN